ncbi:Methyltransferase domain-containing protein [Noviherbaspirillum suwonense]|jgi:trans-aconitate methyltransferase|uniref:Methyltransferase domain-containing protein n=2 Tax=Noviherbaspirillum suwonense TaxID=1224511 RepID=A0ABY1QL77_9BURK|nr:Methyltransferase domain-containing protein [Noviherbaspirillum suwonense]
MSMTSIAGQSGLRRESTGSGGTLSDCQVAQGPAHSPPGFGADDNFDDADHAAHYLAICELLQRHAGDGSVLDIGCGDGRLYHYLTEHAGMPASCYTGIDICGDAVRLAAARFPEARIGRRDYGAESVASQFDCVIFNDSLHCFADPAMVLDKCIDRNMHACSVLIVAMPEGMHEPVWELLAQRYRLVDERKVRDACGSAWAVQTFKLPGSQRMC